MYMICPDCRGAMVPVNEKTARCTVHGGTYSIVFSRYRYIPSTGVSAPVEGSAPAILSQTELVSLAPPGLMCYSHPGVSAAQYCSHCGVPMCKLCTFTTPNGTHLCPVCIANPTRPRVDVQKKYANAVMWSYALAILATIMSVVLYIFAVIAQQDKSMEAIMGLLVGIFLVLPTITGIGLAIVAMDKRSLYRIPAIISLIWNSIGILLLVILMIIGMFSGGA